MGYIIKNTSGLVNTRVTDTGRQRLSEGNFKISYFASLVIVRFHIMNYSSTYNQSNTVNFRT
jgi:hypothetical protein